MSRRIVPGKQLMYEMERVQAIKAHKEEKRVSGRKERMNFQQIQTARGIVLQMEKRLEAITHSLQVMRGLVDDIDGMKGLEVGDVEHMLNSLAELFENEDIIEHRLPLPSRGQS